MGIVDYDDIISMVKAGISKGLIDEKNVIIGGWSQGGFLSYLAITRPDFSFRAAICGAGVVDWDLMTMTSDAYSFESELAGKAHSEEGSNSTQDRRGSPLWHMKDAKTPILILHGEADVRVPVSQAVAFHRGCLHHRIPCEMVIYPREPHFMQERLHLLDMLKRIRRFCDLYLS
jgi:dipeptidyl aminopeptidase/acylaminoacyl peptidase